MTAHRIHVNQTLVPGLVEVLGEEAHHAARVKRVEVGDKIELLNGRGGVGEARVEAIDKPKGEWRVVARVESVTQVVPLRPRVEVCSAAPKGAHLADMIDGLSQVGAGRWALLETERGVSDPGAEKLDRLMRVATEASKQSGRAWHMEIGGGMSFVNALAGTIEVVMADASGVWYEPSGCESVRLLIGPEGGWTAKELEQARSAGARVCRFGVHTMRIETAAVVAVGVVMSAELGRGIEHMGDHGAG